LKGSASPTKRAAEGEKEKEEANPGGVAVPANPGGVAVPANPGGVEGEKKKEEAKEEEGVREKKFASGNTVVCWSSDAS